MRANVDIPEEAEAGARSGAEGVGLMRTEFLVVGRATMPDEEEQYKAYRHVVEAFGGRPVVIRTFDVGGDKLPIGGYPTDPNPFLGWRAIRMCLDEPELFKTQLRALLRAAMHGDVRIMFPLIITLDEVKQAKHLLMEAAAELDERKVPYRHGRADQHCRSDQRLHRHHRTIRTNHSRGRRTPRSGFHPCWARR